MYIQNKCESLEKLNFKLCHIFRRRFLDYMISQISVRHLTWNFTQVCIDFFQQQSPEVFYKKAVFNNFTYPQRKTCAQSLFLNKVEGPISPEKHLCWNLRWLPLFFSHSSYSSLSQNIITLKNVKLNEALILSIVDIERAEGYSEPSQTSKKERFVKIVHDHFSKMLPLRCLTGFRLRLLERCKKIGSRVFFVLGPGTNQWRTKYGINVDKNLRTFQGCKSIAYYIFDSECQL